MLRFQDNRDKEISLSQKELLLMRLSNHIEQAQVDSPAFMLSSLAQKGSEELVAEFFGDQPFMDSSSLENFMQSQLYVCTFWGIHDIAKILLDNKADPNFKNAKTLWTPLHAAAFQDHGRVVMLLLEYGANPMSEDYKGRTPADFASASDKIWSHFDIMNISRTSKADYSSPSNHSQSKEQRSRSDSLFDSTTLPLSRPESQINDIFGSGSSTTRSSVMTSSNTSRRSSRTNNSSANMSSILTWD
uniref:glycerophosphodiester phosphodiesterase GDE1-like n=1 Tax=Styela clava TaxID=7725 RepID=UPI00193A6717|nr:glycerophosphodiester phosphodiesterase GDE1-like [Styela clava]